MLLLIFKLGSAASSLGSSARLIRVPEPPPSRLIQQPSSRCLLISMQRMHRSSRSDEQESLLPPDLSPTKPAHATHLARPATLVSSLSRSLRCQYLNSHHTSFFFGSLRLAEILVMACVSCLILFRVYDYIQHNHFGRAGRFTEYTLVATAMLSLRNNPLSSYILKMNWEKMIVCGLLSYLNIL